MGKLNDILLLLGKEKLTMQQLSSKKTHKEVLSCISSIFSSAKICDCEEIIGKLKDKFDFLEAMDPLRIQILTILLSSWTSAKISKTFDCAWHFAERAKNIESVQGSFGLPEIRVSTKKNSK